MHPSNWGCQVWAKAIYLSLISLKSVSSMKPHREPDLTQKVAWRLAHRLCKAFATDTAKTVSRMGRNHARGRSAPLQAGGIQRRFPIGKCGVRRPTVTSPWPPRPARSLPASTQRRGTRSSRAFAPGSGRGLRVRARRGEEEAFLLPGRGPESFRILHCFQAAGRTLVSPPPSHEPLSLLAVRYTKACSNESRRGPPPSSRSLRYHSTTCSLAADPRDAPEHSSWTKPKI